MNADQVPTTITKWFEKAIQYDSNFQMAQAIMNQGKGKMPNRWTPHDQTQNQGQWDPNAMDIRALTSDKQSKLMRLDLVLDAGNKDIRIAQGQITKETKQTHWRNGLPRI